VLPAFALAVPMESELFQIGPDFPHRRDIEFQPDPSADNLGFAPNFRHLGFQRFQQGKRVACGIGRHGFSFFGIRPRLRAASVVVLSPEA
jgi:hypothetical protein